MILPVSPNLGEMEQKVIVSSVWETQKVSKNNLFSVVVKNILYWSLYVPNSIKRNFIECSLHSITMQCYMAKPVF